MNRKILSSVSLILLTIISILLLNYSAQGSSYLPTFFILISILWGNEFSISNKNLVGSILLILSSLTFSENLLIGLTLFEVGILFFKGLSEIRRQVFSLIPLFVILIASWPLISNSQSFDMVLFFHFLFAYRFLEYALGASEETGQWSCLILFSFLFSSWWNYPLEIAFYSLISFLVLDFFLEFFKFKSRNVNFYNLVSCVLILISFKFNVLGLMLLLLSQIFSERIRKDSSLFKDELLIIIASIIFVLTSFNEVSSIFQSMTFLLCIFLPLFGVGMGRLRQTSIAQELEKKAIMNILLCILGVVSFAFS